jgi:hypothetical protein
MLFMGTDAFKQAWQSNEKRIKSLLEQPSLTSGQVEQIREWIKEGEVLAFEIEQAANEMESSVAACEEALEDWLVVNEVEEDVNDPSLYETDLFGNPTRRS